MGKVRPVREVQADQPRSHPECAVRQLAASGSAPWGAQTTLLNDGAFFAY